MRILHFVYDHPSNPWCGGGGAQRSWQVNRQLAKKHEITVCCGAFPGCRVEGEPFEIRFLGQARRYTQSRLSYMLHSFFADTAGYDLIVEDFSAFSPALLRRGPIPVVTVVHYYLGPQALTYRRLFGAGAMFAEKLILNRRNRLIAVSAHLQKFLNPKAEIRTIPPGVDLPERLPEPAEHCVLFAGRFDIRIKGLDTLIAAWRAIPDHQRRFPLHLIGDGDREELSAMIRTAGLKDVRLLGRMGHEDLMRAMRQAAIVCIPSRMEGCGLVFYEAAALGKPVIASRIPSFETEAAENCGALLVPPGDPAALSEALILLMNDDSVRRKLADQSMHAGAHFGWQHAADAQERVYVETVNRRGRRKAAGNRHF